MNSRLHCVASMSAGLAWLATGCFDPQEEMPSTETEATSGSTGQSNTTLGTGASTSTTGVTTLTTGISRGSSTGEDCGGEEGCPCEEHTDCVTGSCSPEGMCIVTVCGDGLVEGSEICDDSNRDDADGCDADCTYTEILDVEAGLGRTCVLIEGGRVRCWGTNSGGQAGYGHEETLADKVPSELGDVMLPGPLEQLHVGDAHNCGRLLDSLDIVCWGLNIYGQLGQGHGDDIGDDEFPSVLTPVDVGLNVERVRVGGEHTCALTDIGTARCWGRNFYGALGYGNDENVGLNNVPADAGDVPVGAAILDVFPGIYHTCALLSTGGVRCWGDGDSGALGHAAETDIGTLDYSVMPPVEVPASVAPELDFGEPATYIAGGWRFNCALFESGAVRCWGRGVSGELGTGSPENIGDNESGTMAQPVDLGGAAVLQLSAGDSHVCALLDDGALRCWGLNSSGQLGLGSTENIGDGELPTTVDPIDVGAEVIAVDAGGNHTCVITVDHRLKCWGANFAGQLGYGHTDTLGDTEAVLDIPFIDLH